MNTKELIGKTISSSTMMKRDGFDDKGWLKLGFSDGTSCIIVANHGVYTGRSVNEYPLDISVCDDIYGLVEAEDLG